MSWFRNYLVIVSPDVPRSGGAAVSSAMQAATKANRTNTLTIYDLKNKLIGTVLSHEHWESYEWFEFVYGKCCFLDDFVTFFLCDL